MNILWRHRWSPYAAGAAIGVLNCITFGWMHQLLGVSSTVVHALWGLESVVAPLPPLAWLAVVAIFLGVFFVTLDSWRRSRGKRSEGLST